MKKIKKGFTMIEMVSTIAIASILIVALSSLIIFISQTQGIINKRDRKYLEATQLKTQVESLIDQHQDYDLAFSETNKHTEPDGSSNRMLLFKYEDENEINYYYEYGVIDGRTEISFHMDSSIVARRTIYKADKGYSIASSIQGNQVTFVIQRVEDSVKLAFSVYVKNVVL